MSVFRKRLPEDLNSTGIVGLIAAINHFDPAHNVKLKTYAEYKIRGAILRFDWAPSAAKLKTIEAAIAAVDKGPCHRRGDPPSSSHHAGVSWLVDIRGVNLGSLEGNAPEEGVRSTQVSPIADEHWPSRVVEKAELQRILAEAIERMLCR